MPRSLTSVLVAGASVVLLAASSAAPATATGADPVDQLRQDLDRILEQPGLPEAVSSVMVREADGTVLYSRDEIDRLMPASNTKLLTSAAALEVLGSDHRFSTSVLADGRQQGSVLDGDLYLQGKGDPTLRVRDLNTLAAKVAATGIDRVDGRLVADDTWFDDVRYGEGWSWDYEYDYYAAQTSALNLSPDNGFTAGNLLVETRPGDQVGEPARLTTRPGTSYVDFDNQTETVAAGGSTDISAVREHGSNTIVVEGTIAADSDMVESWANVWEPAGYTADVFRRALERQGVEVDGGIGYGSTPDDARPLADDESMRLEDMLVPFLKLSNNMIAEALVKEIGAQAAGDGSWSAGLEVAKDALTDLDVTPEQISYVDGSGLSRKDNVSAEQFTNLLVAATDQPWFDAWYDALPVAGKPNVWVGGTLTERMRGTPAEGNVHAKTGSLTGVTGLSGYVTDADGERLAFSILHNNHIGVNPKLMEDQIAVRLARFGRAGDQRLGIPDLPPTEYGPTDVECSWIERCQP